MLRKVYLYGVLGRRYGWRHELDIESLPEAVWALDANHPGFKRDFLRGPAYSFVKGATRRVGLPIALAEVAMPLSHHDLHIVPAVFGEGGGNGSLAVGKIVLGVAMVAGAFFTAGAAAAGTAALAAGSEGLGASAAGLGLGLSVELPLIGAVTYGRIAGIGAMIALGGVSQLLSPTPQAAPSYSAERPEARPSFIYNGPTNTAEQGGPIPIVYGRMRIGSALVSSSVSTDQVEGAQSAGAVTGTTARASFSGGEL